MRWIRISMHWMRITCLVGFFMLWATVHADLGSAAAAKSWKPNKPLTIILSSYGGTYDFIARQIARVLPDYLGQKVIVQGVTGAEGKNALDMLQRSKPDGRTISLLGMGTYLSLSMRNPYAWNIEDLPVLLTINTPPYAVFVYPKSPYANYEDLVKMKKVVRVAAGPASFGIIPLLEDFEKKGVPYKVARFKGGPEASLAVVSGNADLIISALSGRITDQARSGEYRPLWVYDKQRFPLMPNIPTHIELGMPREWANYRSTRLIQVTQGTPEHIKKALKEGLIQALKDKRTVTWSKNADTPVDTLSDAERMEQIRFLVKSFKEHQQIVETYF